MNILSGTPYEHLDPSTTLSQLDVVKLLTEYCNKVVDSCLKSERKDTDDIIKEVIAKFRDVTEHLINLINSQETKISDLNLKIVTTCSYLEENLYNLKEGLQCTFSLIHNDMKQALDRTDLFCGTCGVIFKTKEHLDIHVCTHHTRTQLPPTIASPPFCPVNQGVEIPTQVSGYICTLCEATLPSANHIESHMRFYHGNDGAYRCDICAHYFRSQHDLASHTDNYHETTTNFNCSECALTFSTKDKLNSHVSSTHGLTDVLEVPTFAIPQCDGNDSISEDEVTAPVSVPTNPAIVQTRVANFELNNAKQTAGIYRDAHVKDFTITAKDNNKNINIECSSGFYTQVAKPTLCSLAQDNIPAVLGVTIFCENLTNNLDRNNLEFNRTMFFKLGGNKKVTVHVHHSTRLVQVQGGSSMPDGSPAAAWFVKNVLQGKFLLLAKSKSYNISKFNDAITSISNKGAIAKNLCGSCLKVLDSRSTPLYCFQCTKQFHKTTGCFRGHKCYKTQVSSSQFSPNTPAASTSVSITAMPTGSLSLCSSPPPTTVPPTNSPSNAAIQAQSISLLPTSTPTAPSPPITSSTRCLPYTSYSSLTIVPPAVSLISTLSSCTSSYYQTSTTNMSQLTTIPMVPSYTTATSLTSSTPLVSSLDPDAPLFQSQNARPHKSTGRTNKKQNSPELSSEKAEIESLKIELGYARTKIVDLEAEVNDHRNTIKIYTHKIKVLEANRSSFLSEKYSYTDSSSSLPNSDSSSSPECSCQVRAKIAQHERRLKELELRISEMQQKVSTATLPPDPAKIVTGTNQHSNPLEDTGTCPTTKPGISPPEEPLDISSDLDSSEFEFSDPEPTTNSPPLN